MFFPFLPFKVGASVKIEKKKKRPEELVEMLSIFINEI